MQINNSLLNSLTDWSDSNSPDSAGEGDFMQRLSAALSPDDAEDTAQQAAQLVSALSGGADTGKAGLTSSDAMFAALTQNMMQTMVQAALTPPQAQAEAGATDTDATAFSEGGVPGFGDVLDIVNPLQHIPVVSQYYRDWTGDDMGYISQVAGGAFWGGSLGVAASFVNLGLTSVMGQSPTQYMQQFFAGDEAATAGSNSSAVSNSPVSTSSSVAGTTSTTARSPISS
ncbi:hypothetical protein [Rheinheimera sp.]|uniref:hypothetical protein n=1 Tax=Rheinheimera sp. TaxID=1869214 RepID=UPI0027345676|nr:hypothetical protein [Rheinheimera sp.]MDP2717074.1 hypothetical protein [Rheinheimera sp.]